MEPSTVLPAPRSGLAGSWDRFVGPGMGWQENALVIGAGSLGAALTAWTLADQGASILLVLLGAVIALDVIGGAVCMATQTTKRWYHRPGVTTARQAAFVCLHLLHIGIVAWAFRGAGFDLAYAAAVSACLVTAMAAVLATPRRLKLPVAVTFFLAATGLAGADAGTGVVRAGAVRQAADRASDPVMRRRHALRYIGQTIRMSGTASAATRICSGSPRRQ